MSGIVIMRGEVDLSAWLNERGLTIRVWSAPDVVRDGYEYRAAFTVLCRTDGVVLDCGKTEIEAITNFVRSLRGMKLWTSLPVPIIVPEFSGIENAFNQAKVVSS